VCQSANALPPQGCRPTFAARPTQCPKLLPVSRLDATVAAAPTGVALPRKGCPHRAPWSRGVRERSQRHRHDACLHVAAPGVAGYDQSKLIVPLREALVRWEKHVLACASPSHSSSGKVLVLA